MSDKYLLHVKRATEYIQKRSPSFSPHVAITLGSGLGKLSTLIKPIASIPYADIPHFPTLTVPGHEGILIAGYLEGVPVIGFKGRKHFYELGYGPNSMDEVVFPVHVAANLGCKLYIATNAAGGLNPSC